MLGTLKLMTQQVCVIVAHGTVWVCHCMDAASLANSDWLDNMNNARAAVGTAPLKWNAKCTPLFAHPLLALPLLLLLQSH